jgi:hypothetical protein
MMSRQADKPSTKTGQSQSHRNTYAFPMQGNVRPNRIAMPIGASLQNPQER